MRVVTCRLLVSAALAVMLFIPLGMTPMMPTSHTSHTSSGETEEAIARRRRNPADSGAREDALTLLSSKVSPSIHSDQTIHVVFCVDHRMLVPLAAAMNSTIQNARHPEHLLFHVMLPRNKPLPSQENMQKLIDTILDGRPARVNMQKVDVSHIMDKMKINFSGYGPNKDYLKSELNYVRFELPTLLPNITKVVYVDPDTIVQGDIGELWDAALPPGSKYALAAVQRQKSKHWFGNPTFQGMLNFKDPQMKQLFSQSELYFNAGVFVADLDKWRERKLSEEMIKWLTINADHNIYQFGSQPPLNMVFYRNYQKLPDVWNRPMGTSGGGDAELKEGRFADDQYVAAGKILHWSGNRKPWVKNEGRYPRVWSRYVQRMDLLKRFSSVS